MTDIPINAHIDCSDGACGKCTNVIINPVNYQLTHIVVTDKSLPGHSTRLVPVTNIANSDPTRIQLNCTKADIEAMPPFIVSNFIAESGEGMAYASGEAYTSQYVIDDTAYDAIQDENIPDGEMALYSGMHIKATDGKLGKLDELVVDPQHGVITNLQMREGHLWGKKDITIPVSAIDFIDGETIYLKLDKASVQALPSVPVKRP